MSVHDSSTWPEFAKVDPEFDAIVQAAGGKLPSFGNGSDINASRQILAQILAQMAAQGPAPDYTGIKKSKVDVPVRDGSTINSLLYQPASPPAGGSPLVLLFHSGGFCMGVPELQEPLALELTRKHGAVVIIVDYRLAPEYPFPIPIEDSYDALKWAAANASKLIANPEKGFVIGGDSAGGNISAVISHLARDEQIFPPLTGVWLNVPETVAQEALPEKYKSEHTSYAQNRDAPLFEHYNAVPSDPRLDMLRDDALLYERELRSQGVSTRIHVYSGVPHAFDGMFPHISLARKFNQDRSEGFAWLFKN
ncbi:hypothetical protein HFD88_010677 [Aspergillus terreus]|nr:hypothetical protein HFD88_010677 [Aspergillus terreus]